MSHLIIYFCSPVLREIRGRIRMCTVHKHTKLKGSRLSRVQTQFFFSLFFDLLSNTKLRLGAIVIRILSKIFYIQLGYV